MTIRALLVLAALHVPASAALAAKSMPRPAVQAAIGVPLLSKGEAPVDLHGAYDKLCIGVASAYDSTRGGYVGRDGVPSESAVELAMRVVGERPGVPWRDEALVTARWMIGLADSVGGGFFLGSKDKDPMNTSFQKWTISNARRLEIMLDAWRATREDAFRRTAARTADYMDRVLLDGRGGFIDGQVGDRSLVPESNGPAIVAWLRWGAEIGDLHYREFAWKSLDRLWTSNWQEGPGLVRRGTFNEITEAPRLVDQVEMGRAFMLAAHLAGRESDLARAKTIADLVLATYELPKCGLRSTAMPDKKGGVKRAPCKFEENGRAVRFLAELSSVTGEGKYREAARRVAAAFAEDLERDRGLGGAEWALALRAIEKPDLPERLEWKAKPAPAPAPPPAPRPPAKKKR